MEIERYGIRLRRLMVEDLEMVRGWRNADFVRTQMEYQKLITPEGQLAWFESLETGGDFYFIAYHEEDAFALVNVKDIDWQVKSGEAGIFVGSPMSVGHPASALIVLTLMDFCFEVMGLHRLYAKIRRENFQVVKFNLQLGYQLMKGEDTKEYGRYSVGLEDYEKATGRLRQSAGRMGNKTGRVKLDKSESENDLPSSRWLPSPFGWEILV